MFNIVYHLLGEEFGIGHLGTFAVNVFRLEKGFKMWGSEMNCDGTILEAGLENFVRMKKKSDFLGKQALIDKSGDFIQQKLVMLEIENGNNVDPEGNESVWLCNKVSFMLFLDFILKYAFRSLKRKRLLMT